MTSSFLVMVGLTAAFGAILLIVLGVFGRGVQVGGLVFCALAVLIGVVASTVGLGKLRISAAPAPAATEVPGQ